MPSRLVLMKIRFVMSQTAQLVLRNIGDILNSSETDDQKLKQSQDLNSVEYETDVLAPLSSYTKDPETLDAVRDDHLPKLTAFETIFAQVSKPVNQSVSLNNQTPAVNGTTRNSFPSCRSDRDPRKTTTGNGSRPSEAILKPTRTYSAPQTAIGRGAGLFTAKSAERKTGFGRASLLESMVRK